MTVKSNTTYSFCDFPNGLGVGNAGNQVSNVTFIGCRFAAHNPDDADVADYGVNIRFSYSTFEPSTVAAGSEPTSPTATPIAASQSYEYGIDLRSDGGLTIDHSDFWGFSDAVQFGSSTQAYPLVISDSWIHNPSYDSSGAAHVDGILDSYSGASYMTFNHDTIVGNGNTQAIALQGNGGYTHVTITNNYLSGFGYTLDFGAHGTGTEITFTGNTWGSDIELPTARCMTPGTSPRRVGATSGRTTSCKSCREPRGCPPPITACTGGRTTAIRITPAR